MKHYITIILSGLLLFCDSLSLHAQRAGKGLLNIVFENYVDSLTLETDSIIYKNALGQNYSVSGFKYYISNFSLENLKGDSFLQKASFLIDQEQDASKSIDLKIPPGEYTSLSFIIGVDSLHNCSGAQSGSLDPVNGMFWAWNTGYIFLKLEGKSPVSPAPGNIFEYHIGGYKAPSNCIRSVKLNFKEPLKISDEQKISLRIKADADQVLRSPVSVDFKEMPAITGGKYSTVVADNYSDMFTIIEILQ